jgi:RNA polymerase sigma-70 factor (ECF subfamily)
MGVVQDALMEASSPEIEHVYRIDALKMWRALVGFSGNREIADDAVAEAFARALHHEGSIRDLRAWTWRVAFRVAAAELRRRSQLEEEQVLYDHEPSSGSLDLVAALRRLPEKQRLALVLHDYADRPTVDVATILGCSVPTVYVHLTRGRRRLREFLEVRDA